MLSRFETRFAKRTKAGRAGSQIAVTADPRVCEFFLLLVPLKNIVSLGEPEKEVWAVVYVETRQTLPFGTKVPGP